MDTTRAGGGRALTLNQPDPRSKGLKRLKKDLVSGDDSLVFLLIERHSATVM